MTRCRRKPSRRSRPCRKPRRQVSQRLCRGFPRPIRSRTGHRLRRRCPSRTPGRLHWFKAAMRQRPAHRRNAMRVPPRNRQTAPIPCRTGSSRAAARNTVAGQSPAWPSWPCWRRQAPSGSAIRHRGEAGPGRVGVNLHESAGRRLARGDVQRRGQGRSGVAPHHPGRIHAIFIDAARCPSQPLRAGPRRPDRRHGSLSRPDSRGRHARQRCPRGRAVPAAGIEHHQRYSHGAEEIISDDTSLPTVKLLPRVRTDPIVNDKPANRRRAAVAGRDASGDTVPINDDCPASLAATSAWHRWPLRSRPGWASSISTRPQPPKSRSTATRAAAPRPTCGCE